ncbi:hypothetical protein [Marinactinospora rubrisoli]|uniref:Antitoxin n=1 Tax=Marinactinospora rubrisoli TaxID=2715399 RepID=A0ABW2KEG5_9ACTN
MGEAARELPLTESNGPLADSCESVRPDGTVTCLTRHGRRGAAIVPADLVAALEAAEDRADALEADAAMAEPGESIPWDQVKAEAGLW